MKLVAATDKGLIIYAPTDGKWTLTHLAFVGLPVGAFHADEEGNWWVAINHKHWGSKLYLSGNEGKSFEEVAVPRHELNQNDTVRSIWTIQSTYINSALKLYIGTEPAALFVTDNYGQSFQEITGLSQHPSRPEWQGGGKGSKNPFLHSIVFHPHKPEELLVGISCAGVFKSSDEGHTWYPTNKGLKAFYLPDNSAPIGHDPHAILRHPQNPEVLWQQNHCGVFRSTNNGDNWQDVSDQNGMASYGFALAIDETDINKAWVIPAQSDDLRYPHDCKLAVYHTQDAGKSWQSTSNGLPRHTSFDLVLRAAFAKKGNYMAFGTNNGNLYLSVNQGNDWLTINQNLSTIRSVSLVG
jgi:hypothetical protein